MQRKRVNNGGAWHERKKWERKRKSAAFRGRERRIIVAEKRERRGVRERCNGRVFRHMCFVSVQFVTRQTRTGAARRFSASLFHALHTKRVQWFATAMQYALCSRKRTRRKDRASDTTRLYVEIRKCVQLDENLVAKIRSCVEVICVV